MLLFYLVEGAGQTTSTAFDTDLDTAEDVFIEVDEPKINRQM